MCRLVKAVSYLFYKRKKEKELYKSIGNGMHRPAQPGFYGDGGAEYAGKRD